MKNSFVAQATNSVYSDVVNSIEQPVYIEFPSRFSSDTWSYSPLTTNGHSLSGELTFVENYNLPSVPERLVDLTEQSTEKSETLLSTDIVSEKIISTPGSINVDNESLGSTKTSITDLFAGINESFSASINKGENALQSSLDSATSLVRSVVENATKSADDALNGALSVVDQAGESANGKLTSFSSNINGVTSKAPAFAIDVLRRTIIAVESSLTSGASYVVYLYGSAKEILPPGIKDVVNTSEAKATEILRPIGSVSQEVTVSGLLNSF